MKLPFFCEHKRSSHACGTADFFSIQIGHSVLTRHHYFSLASDNDVPLQILHCQLPILEAVMMCVERGWMTILVGILTEQTKL